MERINLEGVIQKLQELSTTLGYPINPGFSGDNSDFNFGRGIGRKQPDFWQQYNNFVSLIDGFSIEGFFVYGINNYSGEHNSLFEYNDELTAVDTFAGGVPESLIFLGGTGTDCFVYDVSTAKWEVRDRIAIDDTYESYASFAELLQNLIERIRESNDR